MMKRSFFRYFMVFMLFLGLLSVTSCKRNKVADPDIQGPAGFRIILSGTANPSTLYVPRTEPAVFSHITVTALNNTGTPAANKEVIFQDSGYGYFENYEISAVRRTDAAGVVNMTYFIPPGANIKAEIVSRVYVTLVDDGRLDSAHGQIFDAIPIIVIPYITEGIVLHGNILTPAGNGVGEVTVELIGEDDNVSGVTVTRSSGSYEFYVPGGWYGSIQPSHDAYSFLPEAYTFTSANPVYNDRDGLDFVALFGSGNTLTASPETWEVDIPGGSVVVNVINSTGDSSIGYVLAPNVEWLTVSPSSGSTPGSFTLTADENTTGQDRDGTVLVSATDTVSASTTVRVTQWGTDVSTDAVLAADPSSVDMVNTGTELLTDDFTINVFNSATDENIQYQIVPSDTWFQVSKDAGATNDTFDVTMDINTLGVARNGTITLTPLSTGNVNTVLIPVHQDAGPSITVDISNNPISAIGETFTVWINNDTAPDAALRYRLTNVDSWLSASPVEGSIPAQISITVDPNATGLYRTGVLLITAWWYYDPQLPPSPSLIFDGSVPHIILEATVTVNQSE
jgi:hypothetical protein